MTSSRVSSEPLWKYGACRATLRRLVILADPSTMQSVGTAHSSSPPSSTLRLLSDQKRAPPRSAPLPRSSAIGRTPVLMKPVSKSFLGFPAVSVRPVATTLLTEAWVISAPLWQPEHEVWGLMNTLRPAISCALRAVGSASEAQRSNGVWSETSVDSYRLIARPQKSGQLYCISEYSPPGRASAGAVPGAAITVPVASSLVSGARHHFGRKAASTMDR